jgi:hypothetical protein
MAAMTMIFVLTAEPVALSGEAWAAAAAALGATGAKGEGAGTTAKLDLGDGVDLVAGAMPAAVPGLAEEGPRSVLWPDAEAALAAHRGHVVVVAKGEDAIVARRALALAGTALALAVGAPGRVWADPSWRVATPMARDAGGLRGRAARAAVRRRRPRAARRRAAQRAEPRDGAAGPPRPVVQLARDGRR